MDFYLRSNVSISLLHCFRKRFSYKVILYSVVLAVVLVRVKIRTLVENYPGLELTKGCDQDDDVENYFG